MRWERLFADLAAQQQAAEAAELAGELVDRTRREVARLRLVDRLRAALGSRLEVTVSGAEVLRGTLLDVGADWLLVDLERQSGALVPAAAVVAVVGLPVAAAEPESLGVVASRLGLGYALRGIARDRRPVSLTRRDGGVLHGTIDRVGADFVDVAEHPPGEPRRASQVYRTATVTFGGIAVVRGG